MSDKEIRETHQSYGMVGISRVSVGGKGKMRLFGSALDRHYSTIRLRIHEAERVHNLGYDHFFAKGLVLEVELSAAQFAEFVTTPNCGDGVPCTIRYVNGQKTEDPPDGPKVEAEMVREGFDENVKKVAARLDALTKMVAKLEKGSLQNCTCGCVHCRGMVDPRGSEPSRRRTLAPPMIIGGS